MVDNEKVKKHIESGLDKIRSIFLMTSERIESLKPGEKIPATKLAQEIADQVDTTGPMLYPLLSAFLFKEYPDVKIMRGAHGGILRIKNEETSASNEAQK